MEQFYPYIFKRKSTRKYDMNPLPEETLQEIYAFLEKLVPLCEGISVKIEKASAGGMKGFPAKAPHYLVLYSEEKEGYLVNGGFLFQQMDLFLSSKGLGSCWLGMAKPASQETGYTYVITLAFGKPLESPYRESGGFKRKALEEISQGQDERLEAARLAPSAVNNQGWFFKAEDGKIHVYQKKASALKEAMTGRMNKVDMGIALCHLAVAGAHLGKSFAFKKEDGAGEKKGYLYLGTVQ